MQVDPEPRHRRPAESDTASPARARTEGPRPPADRDAVAAFRLAFDGADRDAALQETRVLDLRRAAVEPQDRREGDADMAGGGLPESAAELAALWAAQRATGTEPPPQAAQTTAAQSAARPQASFADLVERHVRQMLVSTPDSGDADARVMLRLSEASLPDTDLWLSQQDGRWTLQAETSSADAQALLEACAPQLVQRFADGALGAIDVRTRLR